MRTTPTAINNITAAVNYINTGSHWTNFVATSDATTQVPTTTEAPSNTLYYQAVNCDGSGSSFYVEWGGSIGQIVDGNAYLIDGTQPINPIIVGDAVYIVGAFEGVPSEVAGTLTNTQYTGECTPAQP